jgi:hypothetical protein
MNVGRDIIMKSDGSEKVRIDTDGKMGIGTSSPISVLHIQDDAPNLVLTDANGTGGTASGGILFRDNLNAQLTSIGLLSTSNSDLDIFQHQNANIDFWTDSAHRMRIDSSGNVGIGTASPNSKLNVLGSSGGDVAFFTNGADADFAINCTSGVTKLSPTTGTLTFGTNNTERARIDSSGNLLVGKTSPDSGATTGVEIRSDDTVAICSTSDPIILNRRASDGVIAQFRKNGSTVGSIGTNLSRVHIGSDDCRLFFDAGSTNAVWPWADTATSSGDADNTIDLGDSVNRFKDLYLSGGVCLGGTGSVNKLDYYEEGTWTPVPNSGTFSPIAFARYTRIGDTVHFWMEVALAGTRSAGVFEIAGLPFVADFYQACTGYAKVYTDEGIQEFAPFVYNNTTNIRINSFGTDIAGTKLGNGYLNISGTYRTSA